MDVPHFGSGLVHGQDVGFSVGVHVARRHSGIIEIEDNSVTYNIFHVDMVAPDIFHQTTTAAGTLESQSHVGTDESAVADFDILDTAGHLTSYYETAMAVIYRAVRDDEVAAFARVTASVGILAGLDANGVVANIKRRTSKDYVLAGIDVDAVAIGGIMGIADNYILDCKILAVKGMNIPAGAVLESAVLQENALAFAQRHHHWTQESLDLVLVKGRIGIIKAACGSTGFLVSFVGEPYLAVIAQHSPAGQNGFPLIVRDFALLDLAPIFPAAVNHSATGYRNIGSAFGVDGAEAAAHVKTFEIGVYDGIEILIGIKHDDSIAVDIQFDMALQPYRASTPDSGRHLEAAAAFTDESIDSIGESLCVESLSVRNAAEVDDAYAV